MGLMEASFHSNKIQLVSVFN